MNISNSMTYEQPQYSTGEINTIINNGNQEIKLQLKENILENTKENKKEDIDRKQIETILNKSNQKMLMYDRRLDISIHEKTKQIMVKVIDLNTDEVIREIPPEKVLDIVAQRRETLGLLMDKKI